MLTVRWQLGSGDSDEVVLADDDKWSFGRAGADEAPTVLTDDPRISRNALTIRDSGPGPVAFRGQRGDAVDVVLIGAEGATPIPEGTAINLTEDARRIEIRVDGDPILTVEAEFEARPTVKERQGQADAAADLDSD